MANKILIVGGCGYIGGYLTDILKDSYDVTVYDNLTYENRFLKDVNFIYGDIRDTDKLGGIINSYDTVIWLAALVGDGACQVDLNLTKMLNEDSVKWLVDNYKGKIVFTSTCSVYGVNNNLIDEDSEPNPLSAYASTKLEAERYIIKNSNNYLIFRLGTLFGKGDNYSRLRLDLVANILTLKANNNEPLSVFGGEQWRPLLHVKDVAHAIKYGMENQINGLYNLAWENYTMKDLALKIKVFFPEIDIVFTDMKFEDLRNYKVDYSKFQKKGFIPRLDLSYGIKELSDVFRERRVKDYQDFVYYNAKYIKEKYGN